MNRTIVLGSTSQIKIDAVNAALAVCGVDLELVTVKAASGAPEQPFEEETGAGAFNRALDARRLDPTGDFYIAIESGIFKQGIRFFDKAVVILLFGDRRTFKAVSVGVEFPADAIEEARNRGFEEWTVGKILEEWGLVKKHDDPHLSLTGSPRAEFLQEAVEDVLRQAQAAGEL